MKYNDKEIALLSAEKCDLEGRLNYSRPFTNIYGQIVAKERLFKLKGNLLFYFRISDSGKIDSKQPYGVIVLENFRIQRENESVMPFALSLIYDEDMERRHILSGRSDEHVAQWITALETASYEYWRTQLLTLQKKISNHTGKDPLIMVPRNDGSRRTLQWSPKHTATPPSGFQCHLPNSPVSAGNSSYATPSGFQCHLPATHHVLPTGQFDCIPNKTMTISNSANYSKTENKTASSNQSSRRVVSHNYTSVKTSYEETEETVSESMWAEFENLSVKNKTEKNENSWDPYNILTRQGLVFFDSPSNTNTNTISKSKSAANVLATSSRNNPFDMDDFNPSISDSNNLKPFPSPPRRQRSPKVFRSHTANLSDLTQRPSSSNNLEVNLMPTPPSRKRSPRNVFREAKINSSNFYIDDDSDDVTLNPIYQSTLEMSEELIHPANILKSDKESFNLIDL